MTDTNTRDRWSDLEDKAEEAREACRDLGHTATDRGCQSCAFAQIALDSAADVIDDAISHARAVEAENARLREAMEKMVRAEEEARERLQKAGIQINPTPEAEARAALTEPRAGDK